MRRIRYAVAASLDGFIAGPKGEADWIIMDPQFDFEAMYSQFDTVLMGRRSFEASGGGAWGFGMRTIVISRTLRQKDHPDVTIVGDSVKPTLTTLRKQPGKDIWLFGGGVLFRSLLDMGLVDTVELAVMPVLLGDGIPLLPAPFRQAKLKLTRHEITSSGILALEYDVHQTARARARRKTKAVAGKRCPAAPHDVRNERASANPVFRADVGCRVAWMSGSSGERSCKRLRRVATCAGF